MFKTVCCFLVLLCSCFGISQKRVKKDILNPLTQSVTINTANCFNVSLNTHKSSVLKVQADMEGEYAKDLAIKVKEDGPNINISADFLPSFNNPNDKLSAHKVISIALSITLPEFMHTSVYGANANVAAKGKYSNLQITLADGKCTINSIAENIIAKTHKGTITVNNVSGGVIAKSDYGTVILGTIPKGNSNVNLYSLEGDILVNQDY